MEIEIGIGKSGRRAYGFDDIAIVPSRRTRDPDDVDISWEIDAFKFELPLLASAMDGVVSTRDRRSRSAVSAGSPCSTSRVCRRATRTPTRSSRRSRSSQPTKATRRMQELYQEDVKEELIYKRIREIKDAGVVRGRVADATDGRALPQDRARGRARHPGHPRDRRVGRARVDAHRAAEPEALHLDLRHPRDRRWLRVVLDRVCT